MLYDGADTFCDKAQNIVKPDNVSSVMETDVKFG